MAKNIGEACLEIQDIINNQIVPREVCEEVNHLLCDIIRLKNENIRKLLNQQKTKNDAIKNEVINLLKCYRGDEDAKMKNFSFEHYIEIIIDMFDKWDLKGSEENG
jgi:hypothetical protein